MSDPSTYKGRKHSLYLGQWVDEIREQAFRLDRSLSWIVQHSWRLARDEIRAMPAQAPTDEELADTKPDAPKAMDDNEGVQP